MLPSRFPIGSPRSLQPTQRNGQQNHPSAVPEEIFLFPKTSGGRRPDLQASLERVFGEYTGQVIEDLFQFKFNFQRDTASDQEKRCLFEFSDTLVFSGDPGNRRIAQRPKADADIIYRYNELVFYVDNILEVLKKYEESLNFFRAVGQISHPKTPSDDLLLFKQQELWRILTGGSLCSQLEQAVALRQASTCVSVLNTWSLVYTTSERLQPIWLKAAQGADLDVCAAFLQAGLNVNARDKLLEFTPLHHAVWLQNVALCKLLIRKGANLEAQDKSRKTPLHYAVWFQNTALCTLLLKAGASLTSKRYESSLLSFAVKTDALALWEAFVAARVDVNTIDREGKTALYYAIKAEKPAACRMLVAAGAHKCHEIFQFPPWLLAIKGGDEAVYEAFLDGGTPVNVKDNTGKTALHYAIAHQKTAICRLLLRTRDVDVHIKDSYGRMPLDLAVDLQNATTCKVFLETVDTQTAQTVVAQSWLNAAYHANTEVCQAFLDVARNANIKLVIAARCNRPQEFLDALRAGADLDAIDAYLQYPSPLESAPTAKAKVTEFLQHTGKKALKIFQSQLTDNLINATGLARDVAGLVCEQAMGSWYQNTAQPLVKKTSIL